MPNITPYDAGNLGLNPTEIGVESVAAAGRRLGVYGSQIADTRRQEGAEVASTIKDAGQIALNYQTHREVSAGMASGAKLMAGLTDQWNQLISNPNIDVNDPSIKQKFIDETIEPTLAQFQQGFNTQGGQDWAERFSNQYRQHMYEKTSADVSRMARIAVDKNITDMVVNKSNMAMSDPSSVPFLIQSVKDSAEAAINTSPTLTPVDKASARADLSESAIRKIVQAGAVGAIAKSANPEAEADRWIKNYPDYISGADAKTLASNARQQIRANNYDFEQNRRREREIAQDRSTEATNQYLIDVRSQDPKLANDPTAKKILNDRRLTKADKNNLLNYFDRQLKPETNERISQQTFTGLLRDMRKPDADLDALSQKVWDARLKDPGQPGSLSEKDFNQMRAEIVARKTPDGAALEADRTKFFKNFADNITGSVGSYQYGDPKLYAAEMDARRMEGYLRSKGIDPHEAYDPASPNYLGKPERIAKWQGNMQQDLEARASFAQRFGNLPPAQQLPPQPKPVPKVGEVVNGYKYLGGLPGSAASWAKAE